jgi:hypothetical protein
MHRVITRILLKTRKVDVPVHFIARGTWIGDASERAEIDAIDPRYASYENQDSWN